MATCEGSTLLTSHDEAVFVQAVNDRLEVLYGQLNNTSLPDFGSNMLLHERTSIHATTVAHRVLNQFQVPDNKLADLLHENCVRDWLAAEERFRTFSWASVPLDSKSVLYRARDLLSSWLSDFKRGSSVDFTPGETIVTNRGRVSVYQKLRKRENWVVTHDAFDDFARLVYNNRYLKKTAKTFFRRLSRGQLRRLYAAYKGAKHVGFAVFRHRLELEVVTLVHGGRFSSVKKNNEKRRPIIVAPLGNMLLQRTVSEPLREILSGLGNDLDIGQDVHAKRIADPSVATIDFSNASDSNLCKVISQLFPSQVRSLLFRYRDPMVLIGEDYVLPEKLSSMGCGFTFEVMTLLLLSIARVLDPCATVYGDDVIISNDKAVQFQQVMGDIMWKVNQRKSFVNSCFRESCGAYYLDGCGYITCYDFHYCENVNDAVITMNKLSLVADSNVPIIGGLFRDAHDALMRSVPALLVGPRPVTFDQPDLGYVASNKAVRIQRRSVACQTLWKRLAPRTLELLNDLQLTGSGATIVLKPKFVNDLASKTIRDVHETARVAAYLYDGRVSDDMIRNRGEWRYQAVLVTIEGAIPINLIENERKRWKRLCDGFRSRLFFTIVSFNFAYSVHLGNRFDSRIVPSDGRKLKFS